MKYNNYTLYGIHSGTERGLVIGYNSFICISTLIGDTLILVGSLRYDAIKLHKILVIFIQYIAVADLLLTVFHILPGTVSLVSNEWVFGDVFCSVSYFVDAGSSIAVSLLISLLALSKMLIVKYPLRAIQISAKAAHLAACCLWIYGFIYPVAAIAKDPHGVYFSYLVYNCDYGCSKSTWKSVGRKIFGIAFGISVLVSTVITALSCVLLIVLAKRAANRIGGPQGLHWQGVLTVLLSGAVHTIATLPLDIFYITPFDPSDNDSSFLFHLYLGRYAWHVAALAMVANFYIYTLTLSSFREFLKSWLTRLVTPLNMRCCAAKEEGDSVGLSG